MQRAEEAIPNPKSDTPKLFWVSLFISNHLRMVMDMLELHTNMEESLALQHLACLCTCHLRHDGGSRWAENLQGRAVRWFHGRTSV